MNEPHVFTTKEIYLQLDNPLQFRLCRIKEIEDSFIAKISGREKMSKTLYKYITSLDYAGKALLVLSDAGSGVSLLSFTTIIGTPVGIASTSISVVFLVTNGMSKCF